jgi:hypothetical protein
MHTQMNRHDVLIFPISTITYNPSHQQNLMHLIMSQCHGSPSHIAIIPTTQELAIVYPVCACGNKDTKKLEKCQRYSFKHNHSVHSLFVPFSPLNPSLHHNLSHTKLTCRCKVALVCSSTFFQSRQCKAHNKEDVCEKLQSWKEGGGPVKCSYPRK